MTSLLTLDNLAMAQSTFRNVSSASLQPMPSRARSLVIIDTSLDDYQTLVEGVIPGHEVYLLEAHQCGITQITQILREQMGIASLHIFSHGRSGTLQLGSSALNLDNLLAHAAQLQVWRSALAEKAEILLYGCEVAQGKLGKAFVDTLSQLTGADIAASANLTGNAAKGGDWVLEFQTGSIESSLALTQAARDIYTEILPLPRVTVAAGTTPAEIGTTGTFTITLDSPAPVGGLTVNFTPSGTATNPADYSFSAGSNITSVSATSFVIAAGATTATLNVVPVNDGIVDPAETMILSLAAGNGYFLGSTVTAQFAAPSSPVPVGLNPDSVAIGDFKRRW
ncbi:MAG: DUF4347 domain-containing protein [Pegethrix bostrychoides GSE-TBD4-15B]|jgi:hypothetical protein|uniref:DUF4347 domain-containing protein n=1 Tax=Pegethrix bostrychoides GSE-TBD4-15B TaxID=2839662 RepID=A0A951U758_9CYAN|nr:DUF4347 domain-containing protein [Pegethrix bostrychoides GSE-TBD4-15B]